MRKKFFTALCFTYALFSFACVSFAESRDFFMIGETKFFTRSIEGTVDSAIFGEGLNDYFNILKDMQAYGKTYIADSTAKQLSQEIKSGKRHAYNIKTISIGYDAKITNNVSYKYFKNFISVQGEGIREGCAKYNLEYCNVINEDNYSLNTLLVNNRGVRVVSLTGYIYIKEKMVMISSRASYTQENQKNESIQWAEETAKRAVRMLVEMNK